MTFQCAGYMGRYNNIVKGVLVFFRCKVLSNGGNGLKLKKCQSVSVSLTYMCTLYIHFKGLPVIYMLYREHIILFWSISNLSTSVLLPYTLQY